MSKFEEVVKKNDGYFVGGKVGVRNTLCLLSVAGKKCWIMIYMVWLHLDVADVNACRIMVWRVKCKDIIVSGSIHIYASSWTHNRVCQYILCDPLNYYFSCSFLVI
jgi:hypothetical protein